MPDQRRAGEDVLDWHGEPHVMTVTAVQLPAFPFDDGTLEYEIEHPSSCAEVERGEGDHVWTEYECDVAYTEANAGMAFSLRYSGTPIEKPGTYRIQGWGSKHYVPWCGYEYDGGVGVMADA